jgi:hypothetical protein
MVPILIIHIVLAAGTVVYGVYLTCQTLWNNRKDLRRARFLVLGTVVTVLSGSALALLIDDRIGTCINIGLYTVLLTAMHIITLGFRERLAYTLPISCALIIIVLI